MKFVKSAWCNFSVHCPYFIIKSIQYGTIAGEAYNWIAIGRWK